MSEYTLLIVESPAKAHTIGRYLGKNYRVIASQGHVRDLPKSQLGVDVDKNFEPKYITIRGRGDLIADIRKEARGAKKILLATDPDREGEAISWHLCSLLGLDPASHCRVEFNEITKKAVKAALASPRSINLELVDAQQARRVLDRLVGYKISPILWAKVKKGLSAGRVQSVATRLVVEREEEIDAFVPEEYWLIDAAFQSGKTRFDAQFWGIDGEKKELKNQAEAESIVSAVSGKVFSVSDIKTSTRYKSPSAPFTTASLQQDASRKLNFTASKTMQIAQQLYEGVEIKGEGAIGLVTYIRTDSTRISDEAIAQVRNYISENYPPEYLPQTPNVYRARQGAQDAHEAIRPSMLSLAPDQIKASLTNDQYKLYRLIYNRFIACQMTPAAYDTLTADIKCGDILFRHSSQKKSFSGFTAVYEEGTDDESVEKNVRIPKLRISDTCQTMEITPSQHFTQPPARYTEASLVKTLEDKGIGRPSTYAPTISTILGRGYVVREKKRLYPTELGKIVTSVMSKAFPDIVDIEFTAQMETQLDEIAVGELKWQNVIDGFYAPFEKELSEAEKQLEKVEIAPEVSDVPCPSCGAMLVYRRGRFGRFLACPRFPECRYTQTLLTYIDAPCPKCGKRLIERINKKGRKFYGCEDYPACDFVSWDMPVRERCPKCGGYMTLKYLRGGAAARVCQNESCRYREEVKTEDSDE
ncbi:MAG: type I DNA topoisomerase [Clostridiales bacterium]|nr:type I DNA topoisomerase [Clostridiales bacterium]